MRAHRLHLALVVSGVAVYLHAKQRSHIVSNYRCAQSLFVLANAYQPRAALSVVRCL